MSESADERDIGSLRSHRVRRIVIQVTLLRGRYVYKDFLRLSRCPVALAVATSIRDIGPARGKPLRSDWTAFSAGLGTAHAAWIRRRRRHSNLGMSWWRRDSVSRIEQVYPSRRWPLRHLSF